MINIGDWIRKWSFLQPHKKALIFEDHPFTPLEIIPRCSLRAQRPSLRGRSPSGAEPGPAAAAGLDFRIIPAGFNAPLEFLTGFTYQELNQRTNQLCHFLLELGMRKGDRVSVLLYNCHQYIEIFFALLKIGAILVPLNWRLAGPELEFIIKDSGSRMLIFEPEKVAKYKIPKYAEYIEELPKTASGKIQKFLLKERHQNKL